MIAKDARVVIVGGGLIGLGTARALQRLSESLRVTVWEKEPGLGRHQSTHNSGVLHAGLYYRPGSAKARLAVRGLRMMREFAETARVRHEPCGKLVVATSQDEVGRLRALLDRGKANGLTGLQWLDAHEARAVEPHVNAVAAIHVPEEGIIDYAGIVSALGKEIESRGGVLKTSTGVTGASRQVRSWVLRSKDIEERADFVINCAGLHCDRVARLLGARPTLSVVPFRGEYFHLGRPALVKNLIYPVPDPRMPFLGVHFTRMIGGTVECGPNAVLALHREGYKKLSVRPLDAIEALTAPRVWRFAAKYPRMVAYELLRSLSRTVFLRSLQRLVPEVEAADLQPGGSGVRAQAMHPDGSLADDFEFLEQEGALHVLNAPSPGATASLAIGEEIANRAYSQLRN